MARQKSFRNFGLIRTNNLSDVENPRESLTNVLNNLVSGDVKFTAVDIDPIQTISDTNVRAGDFQKIAGVTVEQSVLNENEEVVTRTASPFVTVKNRIDQVIQTTDNPPFFNGGDGLSAKFWEPENISDAITKGSTGDDIFTGDPQVEISPFWTTGFFQFTGNLDETLAGSNGGIQWSGFYIPNQTGRTDFDFNISGLFMLELENASGVLEVVKSIHDFDLSLTSVNAVNNENSIQVSAEDYKYAATGATFNPGSTTGIVVTDVEWDKENDTYTVVLSAPVTLSQGETFTLSYDERIGVEAYEVFYPFRNLEAYAPRQIRITYWFPGEQQYFFKVLDANFRINDSTLTDLQFFNLYTQSPEEDPEAQNFKNFFNNRLLVSGGTIGPETVNDSAEYESVKTVSPLFVGYTPPETFSDILKAQYSFEREINSNILAVTSTSPLTANLEIGNVALGEGIPLETSITEVSTNNVVVLSAETTQAGSSQIDFVEHRGLVKVLAATSSGSTVTVSSTETLQEGMIVITSANTSYIRISAVNNTTTFETDSDLNLSGTENIFIYLDKGVDNRTLENFCIGVLGKETAGGTGTVVSQGATTLPLNNVNEIQTDMVVQSTGFIPSGTVVDSIDSGNNTVTISNGVLEDMIAGITVVFAPAGTTLNKEQCIIPLNTAPPFTGTDTGLSTTGNVSLTDATAKLNVLSLNANNVTVETLDTTTPNFDRKVQIQIKDAPYLILGLSS